MNLGKVLKLIRHLHIMRCVVHQKSDIGNSASMYEIHLLCVVGYVWQP